MKPNRKSLDKLIADVKNDTLRRALIVVSDFMSTTDTFGMATRDTDIVGWTVHDNTECGIFLGVYVYSQE